MTSKLKCPICGGDIQYNDGYSTYDCKNNPANHNASEEIWQSLIQARQDLETLKQALEKYADEDMWENCCIWDIEYIQGLFLEHGYKIAKEALEQIEHFADVSKMIGQN